MKITASCFGPFIETISKPLAHYSQYRPASLTMQQYLDFGRTGTARNSFRFLKVISFSVEQNLKCLEFCFLLIDRTSCSAGKVRMIPFQNQKKMHLNF